MNVLFLTLLDFNSIDEHNIYTDLLRKFYQEGHSVYVVSPVERKNNQKTHYIKCDNHVGILKLKIGNIQKTNIIEKGISTVTLEQKFIQGIKKYYSDIKFDLILYSTPPITLQKAVKYVKTRDNATTYLMLKDIFPQNAVDMGMLSKHGLKGILYKYFRLKEKSKDMVIDSVISAPYFVMETTKADVLFKNMKQSKQSMAIVLDEYGGVVGIVTLFDLLEEIVGDLNDIEPISSEEETVIIRINDNKWEVKGNIRLSDIEDAIGVTFTAEDCDTFTGFVFQKFGMVPKDGDTKIELEIENMHIIIDKIKEHQVEHAIIEILE